MDLEASSRRPRQVSRRRFLQLSSAAVAGSTLTGLASCIGPIVPPKPHPSAPKLPDVSPPVTVFAGQPGETIFHGGVAVLPDGRWILAYMDRPPAERRASILGRWSLDEGRTYGAPFSISQAPSTLIDPTILAAPGGKLIVQYHTSLQSERGRIRQVVSVDGGLTWTDPLLATVVAGAGTPDDYAWEAVLLQLRDGTLLTFYSSLSAVPGEGRSRTQVAVVSSSDEGDTWSDPVPVRDLDRQTAQIRNVGLELQDGRILCLYATWEDDPVGHVHKVKVSFSDDGGQTWQRGAGPRMADVVAAVPGVDFLVPWPIQMVDGRIRVASVATFPGFNGRQIWVVDSLDGGAAWSDPMVANNVTNGVGRPVINRARDANVMYEVGLAPTDISKVVYQLLPL
jgi:hypothetical protein